jgi:hypothetical protein
MDKKLPSTEKLQEVIRNVVSSHLKISSQEKLCGLVLKRLRQEDKSYVVSPVRVKRISLDIPEIEIRAKTRKNVKMQKISECPVCHAGIESLKVMNLANQNVTVGYQCTSCAYQSDLEAFMPMKYAFLWKEAKI